MCGIVGIVSRHKGGFWSRHADLFTYMLAFDSIRGEDSTGLFAVTKRNRIDLLKGDADGYLFTRSKNYQDLAKKIPSDYQIVIGHNRKATAGAITPANAHPFQENHIIIVHNGVVRNFDKLSKDIKNGEELEVDSHALAHLLAKQDAKTALEQINGAFALVWYDAKNRTLNLARNDERPLGIVEYDDVWVISSEFGLPLWLQRREQKKEVKCITVPTDKILTWHMDELNNSPKELGWEEYAAYQVPVKETKPPYEPPFAPPYKSSSNMSHWPKEKIKPMFGSHLSVVHQDKVEHSYWKEGMQVMFSFDSDKETQHGGWEVIGTAVIEGTKVESVLVRWPMTRHVFDSDAMTTILAKYNFFLGQVRAVGTMHGAVVLYVHNVEPIRLLRSFDGSVHNTAGLKDVLKGGCKRCNQPIIEADVERTIIKKGKDGKYRVLCHECLNDSIKNAELSKVEQGKQQSDLQLPAQ